MNRKAGMRRIIGRSAATLGALGIVVAAALGVAAAPAQAAVPASAAASQTAPAPLDWWW